MGISMENVVFMILMEVNFKKERLNEQNKMVAARWMLVLLGRPSLTIVTVASSEWQHKGPACGKEDQKMVVMEGGERWHLGSGIWDLGSQLQWDSAQLSLVRAERDLPMTGNRELKRGRDRRRDRERIRMNTILKKSPGSGIPLTWLKDGFMRRT